jgi:hypothetical protein
MGSVLVLLMYAALDGARRLGEAATWFTSLHSGRPLAATVLKAATVPIAEGIWTGNPVEECAVYGVTNQAMSQHDATVALFNHD